MYLVIHCECPRLSWPMTCTIETCSGIDLIWICKVYTVVYFVDWYCWWLVYTMIWCCPKIYKSPMGKNSLWKCLFLNWNCFAHLRSPKYSYHSKPRLRVAFYQYKSGLLFLKFIHYRWRSPFVMWRPALCCLVANMPEEPLPPSASWRVVFPTTTAQVYPNTWCHNSADNNTRIHSHHCGDIKA